MGKTEKRTFKTSVNSWAKVEPNHGIQKKPKSDLMSKKLDFLEQKMFEHNQDLEGKYKSLNENL